MINIHHTVTSIVQLLETWNKLQQQDGSIKGIHHAKTTHSAS